MELFFSKIACSIFTMDVNVSLIGGNVSTELKQSSFDDPRGQRASKGFELEIAHRIVWKEMTLLKMAEEQRSSKDVLFLKSRSKTVCMPQSCLGH